MQGKIIFSTREHDSLKISNGKWMWWSRGFGGASALDYLIKVKGIPFTEAMKMILKTEAEQPPFSIAPKNGKAKRPLLPEKAQDNHVVLRYLAGRGIDREILGKCIDEGLLYESLPSHSAIFLGFDENNKARYAFFRGTGKDRIMGEAAGSDKHFSFAGQPTQNVGISFLKGYAAVCLEGAIIVLACIIFTKFASTPPVVDADAAPAAMVWKYVGELVFNMLVLVGSVKMSDAIVREMMGL